MEPQTFTLLFALLFGAIIGSFLNVVIHRLPTDKSSIVYPASHCPRCHNPLSWYENIPILSYLALRGRCSHCHDRISVRYPVVEICMALLSAAIVHRYGLTLTAAGYFLFCAALLVIIWIDLQHQIIPDVISLPGILVGLIFSLVNPNVTWQDAFIGLLLGGGVLYAIALFYFLWRKQEGMGGGDIKLQAMIGAFLGWQALPFVIFASSLTGSCIGILAMIRQGKGTKMRIPFGPFLSLAALVYLFFTEQIHLLYRFYLQGSF
jgi:leader peptidase (prepilin peptidase)/N-methyltransferase